MNFGKFLSTPFLTEHLWWLLLYKIIHMINKRNQLTDSDKLLVSKNCLCVLNPRKPGVFFNKLVMVNFRDTGIHLLQI